MYDIDGNNASNTLIRAGFSDAVVANFFCRRRRRTSGWVKSAGGFDEDNIAGHVVLSDGSIVVAGDLPQQSCSMTQV